MVLAIAAPAVLLLASAILAPALARLLLWPGFLVYRALGISGFVTNIVVQVGVSWLLWSAIFAAAFAIARRTIWHRKGLLVVCSVALCAILYIEGRGRRTDSMRGRGKTASSGLPSIIVVSAGTLDIGSSQRRGARPPQK